MSKTSNIKAVIEALQKLYPKQLADGKWDNTGLLVDALIGEEDQKRFNDVPKILLTIDLTKSVCDEAIKQQNDLVIAYHPFIFSGIKAVNSENPQHKSLIRLLRAGISVYSPHTAVDAATYGVNDWLADIITANGENEASKKTVQPITPPVPGYENAGYGRLVTLKNPLRFEELVKRVKAHLWMPVLPVVQADRHINETISTVAVCAGSGGSVLSGVDADLWFTGELGHHQMLYLKENGTSTIVCGHSNSERLFLVLLREQLIAELKATGKTAFIKLSETDSDPLKFV